MDELELLGIDKSLRATFNALFRPALEETGHLLGDRIRGWRARNLASVVRKVDTRLAKRNVSDDDIAALKLAVGLPILERASAQDDEVLQDLWANLIVSSVADGHEIDPSYIEILHQFTRLDCEVLDFVVHNTFASMARDGDFMAVVAIKMEDIESKWHGAKLSVEKLSSLGCMELLISTESRSGKRIILPTLFGARLYIMSSGKSPDTLQGVKDLGSIRMA